ncbi:hypothetical protein [Apilactobacillus timberlakei]|uniref:hypothetical protein n=1 Tax=Apilactobacillus timberlakei TaxID=2008380 RepID=UPI001127E9F4|nr:hypothetical protein [Apilactobacillus timberlakei]
MALHTLPKNRVKPIINEIKETIPVIIVASTTNKSGSSISPHIKVVRRLVTSSVKHLANFMATISS